MGAGFPADMNGKKDATGPDSAPASSSTVPKSTTPAHIDTKPSTAPSATASANGNGNGNGTNSAAPAAAASGAMNKKRKKDGLKPIITIEGPAPV